MLPLLPGCVAGGGAVVMVERVSVLQGTALGDVVVSGVDGVVFLASGCCGVRGVRGDGDAVVCSGCGGSLPEEFGWTALHRHPVCIAVVAGILARADGRDGAGTEDRRAALRLVKAAEALYASGDGRGGFLRVVR